MNKNIFLLMIFVSVISCTPVRPPPPQPPPPPPQVKPLPDTITIAVTTDNYRITSETFVGQPPSNLKYAGHYKLDSTLYFKIEQNPSGDCFWFGELPPLKSGRHELVAKKICKPTNHEKLPPPLDQIDINVVVENRRIISQKIANYGTETLDLSLSKNRRNSDGRKIGVIESKWYPGEQWEFFYPTENGKFTIIAQRKK